MFIKNIDLYIALAVSISLAVLNIPFVSQLTGINVSTYIESVLLAAFAVLTVSILQDRKIRKLLLERVDVSEIGVIQDSYPTSLISEIENSPHVRFIGISMLSHLQNYSSILERKLKTGDRVDVLITDPKSAYMKIAAHRDQTINYEYQRDRINKSIESMSLLKTTFGDNARLKTTQAPIDGEYVIIYAGSSVKKLYFKHYGYKTRYDSSIYLNVDETQQRCFDYFKMHTENLWDHGNDK